MIFFEDSLWRLNLPQKQVAPADKQPLRVFQDQQHFSRSASVHTFPFQLRYTILLLGDAFFSRADLVFNSAQLVRMNGHGHTIRLRT